jgi:preprotein translocase subunit SecE
VTVPVSDRMGRIVRKEYSDRVSRDLRGVGMKKIVQFFKECYAELRKVVWPTREDVVGSVKVVVVSTIVFAVLLGLVDALLLVGVNLVF